MRALRFLAVAASLLFALPALAQVSPGTSPLSIAKGGTGGATASAARTSLGLGSMAMQNANSVAITGGSATGFSNPTNPSDVATKNYVDNVSSGLNILAPTALATAAALPNSPTYNNGTAGVGATLTAGANSTLTVDGTVATLNTVVLVNNQASAFQNGIYTVTTAGSGSAAWVLTRATYFNTPAQMKAGSYTLITSGSTNINNAYTLQVTVATVGTSAVNFVLFSAPGVSSIGGTSGIITLGSGLQIAAGVISSKIGNGLSFIGGSISSFYTAGWTGAAGYLQSAWNGNTVMMTDFMGATACDGINFIGGTGGVSSSTLTVASVTSGTLAIGQTIGGPGITAGTTLISGSGTTWTMSVANTIPAGTVIQGGTDQYANMQAFLTQISVNGVAGSKAVTGRFAPGNCFVSAGTPTFVMNSSAVVEQYHLIGHGTTITPDPSRVMDALYIHRGTLSTFPDEQSGVTVEGVTVNVRNNANAAWGIEFDNPHTTLLRNQIYAGDDGTTHNQVNFAGIYGHQSVSTDPTTGPFWSRIIGNVIKGTGISTSALPVCMRFDGQVNALVVNQNTCNEATYFLRAVNACSTTNTNCAAQPNGVVVSENAIENASIGIDFNTNVASLTQVTSWQIYGNRAENVSSAFVNLTTITQQSVFPLSLGPNMLIGSGAYLSNPNAISVEVLDKLQAHVSLNYGTITAGSQTTLGTATATGATTGMPCKAAASASIGGLTLNCYVSAANTVTFVAANGTSAPISAGTLNTLAELSYLY